MFSRFEESAFIAATAYCFPREKENHSRKPLKSFAVINGPCDNIGWHGKRLKTRWKNFLFAHTHIHTSEWCGRLSDRAPCCRDFVWGSLVLSFFLPFPTHTHPGRHCFWPTNYYAFFFTRTDRVPVDQWCILGGGGLVGYNPTEMF
jgi:hypothetical protein